jgi:hypothetical protein
MIEPSLLNALWIAAAAFLAGLGWTCGAWTAGKVLQKLH